MQHPVLQPLHHLHGRPIADFAGAVGMLQSQTAVLPFAATKTPPNALRVTWHSWIRWGSVKDLILLCSLMRIAIKALPIVERCRARLWVFALTRLDFAGAYDRTGQGIYDKYRSSLNFAYMSFNGAQSNHQTQEIKVTETSFGVI